MLSKLCCWCYPAVCLTKYRSWQAVPLTGVFMKTLQRFRMSKLFIQSIETSDESIRSNRDGATLGGLFEQKSLFYVIG